MTRRADRAARDRDTAQRNLDRFTDKVLADLDLISRFSVQGTRTTSPGRGTTISDPTASEALDHYCPETCNQEHAHDTPTHDDQVRARIRHIHQLLDRIAGLSVQAANELAWIENRSEKAQPALGAECQACGRWVAGGAADPIRGGYCDACRKAWDRAGRPDRGSFERERRQASA